MTTRRIALQGEVYDNRLRIGKRSICIFRRLDGSGWRFYQVRIRSGHMILTPVTKLTVEEEGMLKRYCADREEELRYDSDVCAY